MSLLDNKSNDEYVAKPGLIMTIVSITVVTAICVGIPYLMIFKLIPYTWAEFTAYENGAEIKNNWAIWALYDLGGKKLVCGLWALIAGLFILLDLALLKQILFGKKK
jgi:hypothetical protein